MEQPLPHPPKTYVTYERVALAITAFMFLLGLVSKLVYLDWLFDSLYLLAAAFLVYSEWQDRKAAAGPSAPPPTPKRTRLFVCLYLLVDSVLLGLMLLPNPGLVLFMYVALSAIYGAAFLLRLNEQAFSISRFHWRNLFQPPALPGTLGILVPLICMYLPMLTFYQPDEVWTGPVVINLPGTTYMNVGGTIDMGSNVTIRGYQAALGHPVCLVLVGLGIVHLLSAEGLLVPSRTVLIRRLALIAVVGWWVASAKGYLSLSNVANLLFIAGCVLALTLSFVQPRLSTASGTGEKPAPRSADLPPAPPQ